MRLLSQNKQRIIDICIIVSILAAISITYFSLTVGIYDVFPYFFLIPIILIAFSRPRLSIYGTVLVGWLYLILVFTIGLPNVQLYAAATVWFYIFVSLGVLISTYLQSYRKEGEKSCGAYYNSQAGAFSYDRESLIIVDANKKFSHLIRYECDELCRNLFRISFQTRKNGRILLPKSGIRRGWETLKSGFGHGMAACGGLLSLPQRPVSLKLSAQSLISRTINSHRKR